MELRRFRNRHLWRSRYIAFPDFYCWTLSTV